MRTVVRVRAVTRPAGHLVLPSITVSLQTAAVNTTATTTALVIRTAPATPALLLQLQRAFRSTTARLQTEDAAITLTAS